MSQGSQLENSFSTFELLPFIAPTIIDRSCDHSLRHPVLLHFKEPLEFF